MAETKGKPKDRLGWLLRQPLILIWRAALAGQRHIGRPLLDEDGKERIS